MVRSHQLMVITEEKYFRWKRDGDWVDWARSLKLGITFPVQFPFYSQNIFTCRMYSSLEDRRHKYYCTTFPLLWECGSVLPPSAGIYMDQAISPPPHVYSERTVWILLYFLVQYKKNLKYVEGQFDIMLKKNLNRFVINFITRLFYTKYIKFNFYNFSRGSNGKNSLGIWSESFDVTGWRVVVL